MAPACALGRGAQALAATTGAGLPCPEQTRRMSDPFDLFRAWFAEAERAEPNDPNAMTLATATPDGGPRRAWCC